MALERRFFNTCSSRILSLSIKSGVFSSIVTFSSSSFWRVKGSKSKRMSSVISLIVRLEYSSSILPASILERSRISSIRLSKLCPAFRITCAYSISSMSSFGFSDINLERSRIEFNGVLSSCDMLARNSDLYLVLSSNCSALCCISRFRSTITWFFSSNSLVFSSSSWLRCISSSCCTLSSSSDACIFCVCISRLAFIFSIS